MWDVCNKLRGFMSMLSEREPGERKERSVLFNWCNALTHAMLKDNARQMDLVLGQVLKLIQN